MVRLLVPLRLGLVRLRAHGARSALACLGIAAASGVLAVATVAAVAVQDRAGALALAGLAPSDRAVQVSWSGVPGQSELPLPALDSIVRGALRQVTAQRPLRVAVFRQATWGGAYVSLGAVDRLADHVVLRAGRLPRPCTPTRCELLQLGGVPAAPSLSFLHVVGRAILRPGAPLRDYFAAGGAGRPPVLLAAGVAGFTRLPLPDAAFVARSYGWIVPLAPGSVHPWGLDAFRRRLDAAQARLEQATDLFVVAAPTNTLATVASSGRVAARRLLVVGGDGAALLVGFAVLAATRLRRDHEALRRRLRRLGARPGQLLLVAGVEVAVPVVGGTLLGWAAGAGGGALLAGRLGSPGWEVVRHSALTGHGAAVAATLALVALAVVVTALLAPAVPVAGIRVTVLDAVAAGAAGAILLALARGKADAGAVAADGGIGVVLLLLPALALVVLAVAAARLLTPGLRLLERGARRAPVAMRIALLSLARAPGRSTLSAVFFLAAVGVAVFAVSYRATLLTGERQQAGYAVPAAVVLTEDLTKLVALQAAAPPAVAARLGRATPVLRDSGFVSGAGGRDFTLLALPAAGLARIQGWRRDFSAHSPEALARAIRPAVSTRLPGLDLPRAARTLELPATVHGDAVGLSLTVLDRRGDFSSIWLGEHGPGTHVLRRRIPPEARGGRLVALRVTLPLLAAFAADHKDSGTSQAVADFSRGGLELGRIRAGGATLPAWPGWAGTAGLRRLAGTGASLRYLVNRAADSVFRPREPGEGEPVPVVATPALAATAGPGGILPLHVDDAVVTARIAAVARRIPSVEGDAVVADAGRWRAAATAARPGSGAPTEWWIDDLRPGAASLLRRPPFSSLAASSQQAAYTALRSDPLARGTLDVLLVTAAVGLGLAVLGVVLSVVGDRRDESGELFDLEAQGASPADVRRHLLLRAAAVAGAGGAGGLAAGLVVGSLVVSVVGLTAGAAEPVPPLERVVDWPLVLLALAAVGAVAATGATLAARGAFAAAGRRRYSEGLE